MKQTLETLLGIGGGILLTAFFVAIQVIPTLITWLCDSDLFGSELDGEKKQDA